MQYPRSPLTLWGATLLIKSELRFEVYRDPVYGFILFLACKATLPFCEVGFLSFEKLLYSTDLCISFCSFFLCVCVSWW